MENKYNESEKWKRDVKRESTSNGSHFSTITNFLLFKKEGKKQTKRELNQKTRDQNEFVNEHFLGFDRFNFKLSTPCPGSIEFEVLDFFQVLTPLCSSIIFDFLVVIEESWKRFYVWLQVNQVCFEEK